MMVESMQARHEISDITTTYCWSFCKRVDSSRKNNFQTSDLFVVFLLIFTVFFVLKIKLCNMDSLLNTH